jgi:hypothetical protein
MADDSSNAAERAVRDVVDAARKVRTELEAWMKHYGHDLDSAEAILALDMALRKLNRTTAR